jgi:hypothetical protein
MHLIPLFNLIIAALVLFLLYHVAIGFFTQGNCYRIIVLAILAFFAFAFQSIGQNGGAIYVNGATYSAYRTYRVQLVNGNLVFVYGAYLKSFLASHPGSVVLP